MSYICTPPKSFNAWSPNLKSRSSNTSGGVDSEFYTKVLHHEIIESTVRDMLQMGE